MVPPEARNITMNGTVTGYRRNGVDSSHTSVFNATTRAVASEGEFARTTTPTAGSTVSPSRIPRYNGGSRSSHFYQSTEKAVQTSAFVFSPDQQVPLMDYPTSVWGQQHQRQPQRNNNNNSNAPQHTRSIDDTDILYTQSSSDLRIPPNTGFSTQQERWNHLSSSRSVDGGLDTRNYSSNQRFLGKGSGGGGYARRTDETSPMSKSCLTLRLPSSRSSDNMTNKNTKKKNRFGWVMSSGNSNHLGSTSDKTPLNSHSSSKRNQAGPGSTRTSQASSSQHPDDEFEDDQQQVYNTSHYHSNIKNKNYHEMVIEEEAEEDMLDNDDDNDNHYRSHAHHNKYLYAQNESPRTELPIFMSPVPNTAASHQRYPSSLTRSTQYLQQQQNQNQAQIPANNSARQPDSGSRNATNRNPNRVQVSTTKKQQLQQKTAVSASKVTMSSSATRHATMDLLTPPPVRDRGSDPKLIMQYEQEKRNKAIQLSQQNIQHQNLQQGQRSRGLYSGEIEPVGVRGQQAKVVKNKKDGTPSATSMMKMMPSSLFSRNNSKFSNNKNASTRIGNNSIGVSKNSAPVGSNGIFHPIVQSSSASLTPPTPKSQLRVISPILPQTLSTEVSPSSFSSFRGSEGMKSNEVQSQQPYKSIPSNHEFYYQNDYHLPQQDGGQQGPPATTPGVTDLTSPPDTSTATSRYRIVTPSTDIRKVRNNRAASSVKRYASNTAAIVTPVTIRQSYSLSSEVSEASTCSDDDIRGMLTDLLPIQDDSLGVDKSISFDHLGGDSGGDSLKVPPPLTGRPNISTATQGATPTASTAISSSHKNDIEPAVALSNAAMTINNTPTVIASVNSTLQERKNTLVGDLLNESTECSSSKIQSSARGVSSTSALQKEYDMARKGPLQGSLIDKKSSTGTSTTTESTATTTPEISSLSPTLTPGSHQLMQQVDTLNALAVEHVNSGRYTEAIKLFTQVLHIHKEIHGNGPHPNTASSFHNLGTVHAKRAQALDSPPNNLSEEEKEEQQRRARASALHCFQAAARSARDSLGTSHPNVAVSLVRIGFLLLQAKQYENAETTFMEALRIRREHYGPNHALVANLYNNLGVCRMHLGEFETGLNALEEALSIQRSILYNDTTADANKVTNADTADTTMTVNVLELADTLFNIGGLSLEWIRRTQGRRENNTVGDDENDDDYDSGKRAKYACHVFEEALEIRLAAYSNNRAHPAVLQVQNLLIMAKQYELQHQQIQLSKLVQQKNQSTGSPRTVKTATSGGSKISSTNATSVVPSPPSNQMETAPKNGVADESSDTWSPDAFAAKTVASRGILSTSPRHALSSHAGADTNDNPKDGNRNESIFRDFSSINMKDSSPVGQQPQNHHESTSHQGRSTIGEAVPTSASCFPFTEVTVSMDEEDDNDNVHGADTSTTRIFFAPHAVPKTSNSPKLINTSGSEGPVYNSLSLELDQFSPDVSQENGDCIDDDKFQYQQPLLPTYSLKSCSYDAEENCLISNKGVDSEHGRIHYPLLRKNEDGAFYSGFLAGTGSSSVGAADIEEHDFGGGSNRRDIVVAQPYREVKNRLDTISSNPSPLTASRKITTEKSGEQPGGPIRAASSSGSTSTNNWGSETVNFSTGNKDRDNLMTRARAILDLHKFNNSGTDDNEDESDNKSTSTAATSVAPYYDQEVEDKSVNDENISDDVDRDPGSNTNRIGSAVTSPIENDLLEDGIAPLGDWGTSNRRNQSSVASSQHRDIKELLKDPMTCLPDLHDEAAKRLKSNDVADAIYLFETILRCQRRRFGLLHPDVASSLHNVGIAQLRAQNHIEALKAFEEAARVRKGSLGKDHPLVAVSLVKVGITLLLLHRFEEALWSFREALTVRKNSLGPLHPSTARIYNNIGCVYVEFNEFRQARRAFEAALDTQRSALVHDPTNGPLVFGTATTLCNLGYLYRFRDMHEKAATVLREAAELQEAVLGKSHPTVLSTLDNLADSCSNYGNGNEALKYYTMVLDRFSVNSETTQSSGSKKVFRAESVLHYKMSRVHRLRNDRENQLNSLQQALRALRSYNSKNSPPSPASPKSLSPSSGVNKSNVNSSASVATSSTQHQPLLDSLERRILSDIRSCRELLEKEQLKWI